MTINVDSLKLIHIDDIVKEISMFENYKDRMSLDGYYGKICKYMMKNFEIFDIKKDIPNISLFGCLMSNEISSTYANDSSFSHMRWDNNPFDVEDNAKSVYRLPSSDKIANCLVGCLIGSVLFAPEGEAQLECVKNIRKYMDDNKFWCEDDWMDID